MRRISVRGLLTIIGALAVVGVLLYVTANNYATVTSVKRDMNKSVIDLQERDCYIQALSPEKKVVSGYGPSSYCVSLKVGDKVEIKNGFVTKK